MDEVKLNLSMEVGHLELAEEVAQEKGMTREALLGWWIKEGLEERIEASFHAGELSPFAFDEYIEDRIAAKEPLSSLDVHSRILIARIIRMQLARVLRERRRRQHVPQP